MTRTLATAALLALAACTSTARQPLNDIGMISYAARGAEPFWALAIGSDQIALTLAEDGQPTTIRYPRVLPVTQDGVTRYQSGEGTRVITIEARDGPCTLLNEDRAYHDRVTVSLSGRQFEGCGGRGVSAQ